MMPVVDPLPLTETFNALDPGEIPAGNCATICVGLTDNKVTATPPTVTLAPPRMVGGEKPWSALRVVRARLQPEMENNSPPRTEFNELVMDATPFWAISGE